MWECHVFLLYIMIYSQMSALLPNDSGLLQFRLYYLRKKTVPQWTQQDSDLLNWKVNYHLSFCALHANRWAEQKGYKSVVWYDWLWMSKWDRIVALQCTQEGIWMQPKVYLITYVPELSCLVLRVNKIP